MASDRIQRRIDRLLDQAEEAMDQLNWDAVRQYAQAVLSLDSGNTDGLAYLDSADQVQPNPPNPVTPLGPTSPTPGQADQPTSFANGRYQVKRFLGEGGKKKVYLAQDTLLDSEVAFALIKTEGLDEVPRTRITREAQAMGRLGSHPHIVTVFDLGQENGQPYMVTELMGRGDVEGLIEDAPDHRLPLEQTIDIAKETCSGLKFSHSRGIVHRDLKPGNIWLTSDGRLSWADLRFGNRAPGQCRPNRRSEMEIENKLKAMGLELPSVTPPPPGRAGAVKLETFCSWPGTRRVKSTGESWEQISLWRGPTMERGRLVSTVWPM